MQCPPEDGLLALAWWPLPAAGKANGLSYVRNGMSAIAVLPPAAEEEEEEAGDKRGNMDL
jgi:hypothetical protein